MKCIGNMIGRGRKRKTTIHTDRIIQRKIKTDRHHLSKLNFKPNLTLLFLKQQFVDKLMKLRVARKKPYLNKANSGKRLEYARTYREKPRGFWNNVI